MSKLESAPNPNNPQLNSSETEAINQNEIGLTPETLEKLRAEEGPEQQTEKELSPEEQIRDIEGKSEAGQQEIARLTGLVEDTKSRLNEARAKLGMPPTDEDPPSVLSEKEKLEKLKVEQEELEKQKEELVSQQEKEQLIREEKEKILQERLDIMFGEFEALDPRDLGSIFNSGKTSEGGNFKSSSMGELDPDIAKTLARVFKEGVRLLSEILKALPDLMHKFDEDITKEATERVEKRLEEEKQKMEEQEEDQAKNERENKSEELKPDEIKEALPIEILPEKQE